MAVIYLHLDYEGYKAFEDQCRAFRETTHKSTGGFYHKSLRVKVGTDLIVEFHGPLVGGYGHEQGIDNSCGCVFCDLELRPTLHLGKMMHEIPARKAWALCSRPGSQPSF